MPKGRSRNPSTEKDGIWFSHIGHDDGRPLYRDKSTNTGRMLCEPFRPDSSSYPPQPPPQYTAKDMKNFRHCNPFSSHDNREQLVNDAVVFGTMENPRTMGRRKILARDQQRTDHDMLYHYGRKLTCDHDYNSIYSVNYRGCRSALPLLQCGGTTLTPNCRKFPRQYPCPKPGDVPSNTHGCKQNNEDMAATADQKCQDTSVTIDYVDGPYHRKSGQLNTEDLARTQHHFNDCGRLADAWKYSYRGLPHCYPRAALARSRTDCSNPYPGWPLRDGVTTIPASLRCMTNA